MKSKPRRPGDFLLGRYFQNADPETRERARAAFREFARILEELGGALGAEDVDSRESEACGKIPLTPHVAP